MVTFFVVANSLFLPYEDYSGKKMSGGVGMTLAYNDRTSNTYSQVRLAVAVFSIFVVLSDLRMTFASSASQSSSNSSLILTNGVSETGSEQYDASSMSAIQSSREYSSSTSSSSNNRSHSIIENEKHDVDDQEKDLLPRNNLDESMQYYRKDFQDTEIEEVRKKYWTETFRDIRNLGGGFSKSSILNSNRSSSLIGPFSQWKLASFFGASNDTSAFTFLKSSEQASDDGNQSISVLESSGDSDILQFWKRRSEQRFEGFPSWERLLQDWSDEIQDYRDQLESQEALGYSLGNYGRPPPKSSSDNSISPALATTTNSTAVINEEVGDIMGLYSSTSSMETTLDDYEVEEVVDSRSKKQVKSSASLPIPQPARPGEPVLHHTDISDLSKRILIVTTASMPWRTGTAVNPLLRAAYLTTAERTSAGGSVTLMIPWLERIEDQERVYGKVFESAESQTSYVRDWLHNSANMEHASRQLQIQWYTAWHSKVENSIYSMGDITALIPTNSIDICILEEPEHLNWYRAPGESWTKKFPHVVGILHTNYFSYALDQPAALIRAPAMRLLCSWMCRAHCHRIIKLSGTLDKMAPEKELVENVHGVRETFLDVGKTVRSRLLRTSSGVADENKSTDPLFGADVEPKIYFIGKMLWSKGLGSLMELLKYAEESAGLKQVCVDMYGGGPDMEAARSRSVKLGLDMPFHGPLDHAELAYTHKIFVNPSTSEVLCTTSAEALAMGKFLIIPSHPSNDFFVQFPNCLTYATKEEFVGNLYYAMTHSPEPLADEYLHALSWEAATERLILAACIPQKEDDQMKELVAANKAAIEISLPPLLDNSGDSIKIRQNLATVLHNTRLRYRLFRNRLSAEIKATRVLPKPVGDRLVAELDKRLDIDIDEILESPKLRIKLSPAELDKQLLELYDAISESPSGDVLRVLGGGGQIALQNLYMKRHSERERWKKLIGNLPNGTSTASIPILSLLPSFGVQDVITDDLQRTASQWVRYSLRKNQRKLARSMKKLTLPSTSTGRRLDNTKFRRYEIVHTETDAQNDNDTPVTSVLSESMPDDTVDDRSLNNGPRTTRLNVIHGSTQKVTFSNTAYTAKSCRWSKKWGQTGISPPQSRTVKFSILI